MKSRRSFLKLVAAGSAALLATTATAAAATAAAAAATPARRARTTPAAAPRTPALASEIRKQKEYTAATLKAIRSFKLAPGSEPAFTFAPIPPVAKSRITGRSGARRPKAQP